MKIQFLKWSFFFLLSFNGLLAGQDKSAMLRDISTIKGIFDHSYAPIEWKKENDAWNLEYEYEKAVSFIQDNDLSLKEYQQLLRRFVNSAMDYHVSIEFLSTEEATLPFRVKTVDGHTYVDWVDPLKFPKQSLPLRVGDEILEFDGKPIAQALDEVHYLRSKNSNMLTEIALTDENLTKRYGKSGDTISRGPITVVFCSNEDGKVRSSQLMWEYSPELIKTPSSFMQTIPSPFPLERENDSFFQDDFLFYGTDEDDGALGSRVSFVPTLGKPIWVWDELVDMENESCSYPESDYPMWNAYIYENEEGRKIGYIRIPHYQGAKIDFALFGKIIEHMEMETEALVLDQVNNYGGDFNFLFDIASMLTSDYLTTPKHRLKLNLEVVYTALKVLENTKKKLAGEMEMDLDYQKLLFRKTHFQFIIDEWAVGHVLTEPTYIAHTDIINANPNSHYSKPILILVNELDLSCGDFLPAIMQDNKRAIIFGSRTAGAGGFVKSTSFPNKHGIARVRYTASIAEREGQKKIESLGVSPDIEYKITGEDVQNRYVNYRTKVNEVISGMLYPNRPLNGLSHK